MSRWIGPHLKSLKCMTVLNLPLPCLAHLRLFGCFFAAGTSPSHVIFIKIFCFDAVDISAFKSSCSILTSDVVSSRRSITTIEAVPKTWLEGSYDFFEEAGLLCFHSMFSGKAGVEIVIFFALHDSSCRGKTWKWIKWMRKLNVSRWCGRESASELHPGREESLDQRCPGFKVVATLYSITNSNTGDPSVANNRWVYNKWALSVQQTTALSQATASYPLFFPTAFWWRGPSVIFSSVPRGNPDWRHVLRTRIFRNGTM